MSKIDENNEYNKEMPVKVAVPEDSGGGGYPNNIASTQTKKMNGTGAAKRGIHYSKNSQ